jgi:subtilisin family serine protease
MRLTAVAALAVFAFACADGPAEVPEVDGPAFAKASGGETASYLVMAQGNKLPKKLAAAVTAAGGGITAEFPELGIAVASSGDPNFAESASGIAGVRSVIPDVSLQWLDPKTAEEAVAVEGFGNPPTSGDDDIFFDLQWGHDAVDAPEAWDEGARGAGARVAILDSGIDDDHPDIAPNLNAALSKSFVPCLFGNCDGDVEDWRVRPGTFFNHGTHVAGTVAAADNGFGMIGIAPEAELVVVKVLSEYTGTGSFSWIIAGIYYAAMVDADVINMSLGGYLVKSGFYDSDDVWVGANEVAELRVAIGRAASYAYQQPHVISIAATAPEGWAVDPTTDLDVPASYTNYGQSVISFAAPGGDRDFLRQPGGGSGCVVSVFFAPCYAFDYVLSAGSGGWWWAYGTSMAAPHATGVAALIIGERGGDMHPAQVEAALRKSADDLGKPGNDDFYGAGRVNAYNAVK